MANTHAVVALGSNLEQPEQQVQAALQQLMLLPETQVLHISSLYRTAPVGYLDQPDFINAVCVLETALGAGELLARLHNIENAFGRQRTFRNAPRTLDLDLIDYGGLQSSDEHLLLPHPRAAERAFVMTPLAEIAPDYRIGDRRAAEIAAALPQDGIVKLQAA